MADPEHWAKLQDSVAAWNEWRAGEAQPPDLSDVDSSGRDLSDANFRSANLRGAKFSNANLSNADLRGADLRGVKFNESNLSGASLREANLQGVDLSVAQRGLQTEQLAGADLTGAKLPDELRKLYEKLENVNNISESARKLFLAVLAACLYSWLTIATTTDVGLITNRASSPLPIIQTSIPIVGFYWVAPLLLLCVYFYFHFYLQKLWEELGSLPAIFPDGRPLHTKIDPWLLNDLVRAHLPKLNIDRPFLSYFQLWISVLLAWWVVPITMFLFWGRYLPRQDRTGTTFHVVLLVISLTAALSLYRLAVATLRGAERKPLSWMGMLKSHGGYQTAAFAVAVAVLFGMVSWGAIWGVPPYAPTAQRGWRKWRITWVPQLMALVGYSPFANLEDAQVSQKKPTWSKNDNDLDSVTGAQLGAANLRYAEAFAAFLAGAHLSGADLSYADLGRSDMHGADLEKARAVGTIMVRANLHDAYMRGARLTEAMLFLADLSHANLRGADLREANLSFARFGDADLGGAELRNADLTYCDFRTARNLNLETVRDALHWEKAFYDNQALKALGLPSNHNDKVDAQQEKEEKELQQKANTGQAAPNPIPPKQN